MKALFSFVISILLIQTMYAQAPQKMSYQAVIRNVTNGLVTNTVVGMRLSILQGTASGKPVYVETQTPATNANGLVSIEIGSGKVVLGDLTSIEWSTGPYFLKTETDPTGGTNYTISGTSQLLSVPYALFAQTAQTAQTAISAQTAQLGGINVVKLHPEDELNLVMSTSIGPNVPGSSVNIGDITPYKGLILEWRMNNRAEVFQQFIFLSPSDKDIILGHVPPPANYPRRYTTIIADGFATMMWLGVSIQGTQLFLSTNSSPNPTPRLQRVYGIL